MKPYRVDFKFTFEDQASLYIVAPDEAAAASGALEMISKNPGQYSNPEVVKVEEYQPTETPTSPTLN